MRTPPPHAQSRLRAVVALSLFVIPAAAGCSGSRAGTAGSAPGWHNREINAVSKVSIGGGVAATTALRPDGGLETVTLDLATGRRLWTTAAAMPGRLAGMGVQPPAVVPRGGSAAVVAAVEPRPAPARSRGAARRWVADLVVRDSRTGARRWARPVHSTFGPVRCGGQLCLSEHTALRRAGFVVLDPATGEVRWRLPGIAEPQAADAERIVVFRLARDPVLEAHATGTGRRLWRIPVQRAVGRGVNLSGGWSFGRVGDVLVGYIAPFQQKTGQRLSAFGYFGVDLRTGRIVWRRPALMRVYPSGSPALVARAIDRSQRYAGFVQLDPTTGATVAALPAAQVPAFTWWLAFTDAAAIGFLAQPGATAPGAGRAGGAAGSRERPPGESRGALFDLRTRRMVPVEDRRAWSFCSIDPRTLPIAGRPGFYPIAPLCQYDLGTGRRAGAAADAPPTWYTGSVNGWRLWRAEDGSLRARRDGRADAAGMYGPVG